MGAVLECVWGSQEKPSSRETGLASASSDLPPFLTFLKVVRKRVNLRKIRVVGDLCGLQGEAHQLSFRPWTVQHCGCTALQERVQLVSLCFTQGCSAKPQSTAKRASGVGGQRPVLRSRMSSSVTFLNNCSGNVIIFILEQFWPDKS